MKRRGFISGLLALPFVRWFVPKRFTPQHVEDLRRMAGELSPEQTYDLHRLILDPMIKRWNEEATTTLPDWCKQPFRLD